MRTPMLVLLFLMVPCAVTRAQGSLLGSPTDFIGGTSLIDFETYPDGSALPPYTGRPMYVSTEWLGLGVYISDSTPLSGAEVYQSTGEEIPTYSGIHGVAPSFDGSQGFLKYTFVSDPSLAPSTVTEAGLWIVNGRAFGGGPSLITFFDGDNNPIRSLTSSGNYFFAGLRYAEGIGWIQISDPDYFLTDNFQFGPITPVPEPSICTLVGMGIVAVAIVRRKRRPTRSGRA
jgi:hypothetical protein